MKLQRIYDDAHHAVAIRAAESKRTNTDVASSMIRYVDGLISSGKLSMVKLEAANRKRDEIGK